MQLLTCVLVLFSLVTRVSANVEKVIFVAPPALPNRDIHSAVDELQVHKFDPLASSIRLHLPVIFPNATYEQGLASWYILDDLEPGRRYEVRICWAAIVGLEPLQADAMHKHSRNVV